MAILTEVLPATDAAVSNESPVSAVSWASILTGAAGAIAASLVLVALGTGLGFASLSPWSNEGPSATTFTVMTGVWLIVVQWLASGLGGYLTGRLRTKWVGTHTHEVFFRDTAHGFITWALATVVTSAIVALGATALLSGATKAVSSAASGAAQTSAAAMRSSTGVTWNSYEVDSLFRSTSPDTAGPEVRGEAVRILVKGLRDGDVTPADRTYLAGVVAARTGISPEEASERVNTAISEVKALDVKAREAADAARKAASSASIFTALSMLIGAFIACVAAAIGGAERDKHP